MTVYLHGYTHEAINLCMKLVILRDWAAHLRQRPLGQLRHNREVQAGTWPFEAVQNADQGHQN